MHVRCDRFPHFLGVFDDGLKLLDVDVDYVPADAHWKIGRIERHNDIWRNTANKVIDECRIVGKQKLTCYALG